MHKTVRTVAIVFFSLFLILPGSTIFGGVKKTIGETMGEMNKSGSAMMVENTRGYPGDTWHLIRINGTWDEEIKAYVAVIFYDPAYIEVVEINLNGCVGENPAIFNWENDPNKGYVKGNCFYTWDTTPGSGIPPGEGVLFNIIVNIIGSPGRTSLVFDNKSTAYINMHLFPISPELFDGYLEVLEENSPPYQPSDPDPANGAVGVDVDADLSWSGGDPDPGDVVTYDVYFGTTFPPPLVATVSEPTYDPGTMEYNTAYVWQIVAHDNHGASTPGNIWAFITEEQPNNPPYQPSDPDPANGAVGVDVDADLSWSGGDPDPGDVVTYDVYFGTSTPPPLVVNNQSSTVYDPGTMSYMTTYYWKIVAWDNHDAKSIGQIWSFTTEESSQNNPPNKPDINGPTSGYVGINYTFSAAAIDPDGDQVYYLFDWGDGNTSDWLGPFLSGESINMNHSWLRKGIYNIRVKAKDTHGNESMWSDPFQISISKNIEITNIKTGYVYFFIPAFNRSYAYINIFDRLGVSVIFTIDLLHINVTVGEMVSSVKFVIKSIIFEDELVSYDNDTTDGCLCDFNITTGLYGLTVYAYDEEQNEIDSDMIPYLLFINLSTIRQMRGK